MQKQESHLPAHGADEPMERRPGVPMEAEPPRPLPQTHGRIPSQQAPGELPLKSDARPITKVFATANPPRGLSGVLRRYAYTQPDHKVRHWMTLLLADKVDVLEHGTGRKFLGFGLGLFTGGFAFLLRRMTQTA